MDSIPGARHTAYLTDGLVVIERRIRLGTLHGAHRIALPADVLPTSLFSRLCLVRALWTPADHDGGDRGEYGPGGYMRHVHLAESACAAVVALDSAVKGGLAWGRESLVDPARAEVVALALEALELERELGDVVAALELVSAYVRLGYLAADEPVVASLLEQAPPSWIRMRPWLRPGRDILHATPAASSTPDPAPVGP